MSRSSSDASTHEPGLPQSVRPRLREWQIALISFIALQLLLAHAAPLSLVHNFRVPYEIVKDDTRNIDLAMQTVSNYVRRNGIDHYVVILGDSVGYGGPGGPEQAFSRYLADLAADVDGPAVFNFSLPGAQIGDIYVLLLKLLEHGLAPDCVIINVLYAGFVAREPYPPPVFWLRDELARLDPEADRVTPPGRTPEPGVQTAANSAETAIIELGRRFLPVLAYRDYLRAALLGPAASITAAELTTPSPWYEKPWLDSYLRQAEYQSNYDPRPLVLDQSNPNVYFLERIADRTASGTDVLFFATPVNSQLVADRQADPGYIRNLKAVDGYMRSLSDAHSQVSYANFTTAIDDDLFHDHLHLIPAGYSALADLLWREIAALWGLAPAVTSAKSDARR